MAMNIDVSEIKSYRGCRRQWLLSSRNRFHLRPKITPPQFAFGTLFHEALAEMYLGVSIEKVLDMIKREATPDSYVALTAMAKGYYKNVLGGDLDRFQVLDIEHKFSFSPTDDKGIPLFEQEIDPETGELVDSVKIVGSIDMIALDVEENAIYGFEHKTAKSFRDPSYLWMDEQPRVYTEAIRRYLKVYNQRMHDAWVAKGSPVDAEPVPATLGGCYMNEVKKLLRDFQYQRTLCKYPESDMDNFMEAFYGSCHALKNSVEGKDNAPPNPSYFSCQMCTYKTVCTTYMYANLDEATVIEEFAEEFEKRKEDHLEEKLERQGTK